MVTPKSRKDFERSLNLLLERINNGTISFVQSTRIEHSFLNARRLPNKRMNFHTVDEMLRLNANTVTTMPMMIQKEEEDKNDKRT